MCGPVYIAGPTASGKSALALALAERVGGEIISVDSMQVYKGLDIGTAKPSLSERVRVPHHLVDILELHEEFDAARFLTLARKTEREIGSRGKAPIYCGGTGLYFKAIAAGIGSSPAPNPKLRLELEQTSIEDLLRELEQKDPATFESIDRLNPRRLVRAIEVIRLTGRPFSAQKDRWQSAPPPGIWIGLARTREELRLRIDQRVDHMFAAGLVEETRHLLKHGLEQNRTVMQAIGYRQVVEHLRGERGLLETIETVKQRTRQYAKRQMTWFKRQLELKWIEPSGSETEALDLIEKEL